MLQNIFTFRSVNSVQIGRSLQKLPPRCGPRARGGLRTVIMWTDNVADAKILTLQPCQGVRISDTIEDWKSSKVIAANCSQRLMTTENVQPSHWQVEENWIQS